MRDPLAEPSDLIRSVSRALRVLESVGRAPRGLTVKQIARRCELTVATTYHLVRTLAYEGYVIRREDGTYIVGLEIADRYRDLLATLPIDLPPAAPPGVRHAYHLFAVRVPQRRKVYDAMHTAGIGVQVHYVPIYKHPLYADTNRTGADFPEAERAYDGLLSLPMFPGLTETDQDRVVEVLAEVLATCAAR